LLFGSNKHVNLEQKNQSECRDRSTEESSLGGSSRASEAEAAARKWKDKSWFSRQNEKKAVQKQKGNEKQDISSKQKQMGITIGA